jgi:hypothetical protein
MNTPSGTIPCQVKYGIQIFILYILNLFLVCESTIGPCRTAVNQNWSQFNFVKHELARTLKIIYLRFFVKSTILYIDLSFTINPLILRFWLLILRFHSWFYGFTVDITVLLLVLPWNQQYQMVKLTVKP